LQDRAVVVDGEVALAKANAAQFEHELGYTQVYNEFCDIFEGIMSKFLQEQGWTLEQVHDCLENEQIAETKAGAPAATALVSAIVNMFEYENFIELLRDHDRRSYLKSIMVSWARHLHPSSRKK
jgi:hypothetical protein